MKRLIETVFPVKEISQISAKEKNIRHGHISTLHIWWSRKPLATSRASVYMSLVPEPEDDTQQEKEIEFVINLSKWENSLKTSLINAATQKILESSGGMPPRVLDPFSGGGSIPLEALRLGCEVYANDYNPVATLILKAVLEYPHKFSKAFNGMPEIENLHRLFDGGQENPLLMAVKYWGERVLEKAKEELAQFYVSENGEIPVGFYWMRTIPCQNPVCGIDIPLTSNWWLVRKDNKKVALRPYSEGAGKPVNFKIISNLKFSGYEAWEDGFDPESGTVSRANVVCPACGSRIDDKTTRRLFKEGKAGERLVAVVYTKENSEGKFYRLPTQKDFEIFEKAKEYLNKKVEELREKWEVEPVPDEELPLMSGTFNVPLYGFTSWGDLFNPRQKLALLVFADEIRESYQEMLKQGYPEDFAKAVVVYLVLTFDKLSSYLCSLTRWRADVLSFERVFDRQALPMLWDYGEINPISKLRGSWDLNSILESLSRISIIHQINPDLPLPTITNASATKLPYPDSYFDAVITDPPYYNSVPYADLSDFFYVWLKRVIGEIIPELFMTSLTPKSDEIVEMATWDNIRYAHKDKKFFEERLSQAFKEIHRVLKPEGIAVIVYAHKSTEGWETVINALLNSGLVIDASWPVHTEMQSRLRAQDSAALASSIFIVARKRERKEIGFYEEIKRELKEVMEARLEHLWKQGISGADLFIASIGIGIEVFGKYKKIEKYSGEEIKADTMLEDIRKTMADYTVKKILQNGFADKLTNLTRFYVLWRYFYKNTSQKFDEARKLAAGSGIDLSRTKHDLINIKGETVSLKEPTDRDLKEIENSDEPIDVLHHTVLLWKSGQTDQIAERLKNFGDYEIIYRIAQAISQSLPNCEEKRLLDGFLTGKERVKARIMATQKNFNQMDFLGG